VILPGFARHGRVYLKEATGVLHLTLPERLPYLDIPGVVQHVSSGSDTVYHLASRYYRRFYRDPVSRALAIQQFQPFPILDPLEPIPAGRTVLIPPIDYIETVGLGDSLAEYPQL